MSADSAPAGGRAEGIVIESARRFEMESAAREAYPEECCGVLLGSTSGGRRRVSAVVPIRNARGDSPRSRYRIEPRQMFEVEKRARVTGVSVVGYFHSHPDVPAVPSITDLKAAAWPNTSYVILCVRGGRVDEIRSWTLAEDRAAMNEEPIHEAP
jgi:proteasome lid subunit RPN8/RPN11